MKSPLIVLGHARSGTTLLRAMLNIHQKITMVNEPHLFRSLRSAGIDYQGNFPAECRADVVEALHQNQRKRLPEEIIQHFAESTESFTFKDAYESLLPVTELNADVNFGEKSPENLRYMDGFYELYPEGFYLHIVRDPRSIILSKYRKKFHSGNHVTPSFTWNTITYVISLALYWRALVSYGRTSLKTKPFDSLQIRYEDLITSPEITLQAICDGLEIEYDANMENPSQRKEKESGFVSSRGAWHALLTEPLKKDRAESWQDLPSWALWLIENLCSSLMQELEYRPSEKIPPMWQRTLLRLTLLFQKKSILRHWSAKMDSVGADPQLKTYL